MKRRVLALASAALAVGVAATSGVAPPPASGQGVEVVRDLAYVAGPDAQAVYHRLDLYLPTGLASFPVVVFFHGGGWSGGDKGDSALYGGMGSALASRGVAVALANYRLTDGTAASVTHPGHVDDAARATAFVRAYLNARGFPPSRLLVMGYDAGAHLAALLAANPRFLAAYGLRPAELSGVIGLSGIYRIDPGDGSFAAVFGTDPAARIDASPIDHVNAGSPPHLLLYAEDDEPGRSAEAHNMASALVTLGVPAVAEEVAARDHRGIMEYFGQPGDPVAARVLFFAAGGSLATPTPPPTGTSPGAATATPTATPAPVAAPTQPPDGPGGALRPHGSLGEAAAAGGGRVWWPEAPSLLAAPVVVFVPDVGAFAADAYQAWLEHVARGGYLVVSPVAAAPLDLHVTAAVVGQALDGTAALGGPEPDLDRAVYVGDGAGALVAANLAAGWLAEGLPAPAALLMAAPHPLAGLQLGDLRRLPRDALVLVAEGDQDKGRTSALERALWSGLAEIPGPWRNFLLLRSDGHGTPSLVAGAGWARTDGAGATTDALDWFGSWKWLDALASCAYQRKDCSFALGDTPEQRGMGRWADDVAVLEPIVSMDVPANLLRVARFPILQR